MASVEGAYSGAGSAGGGGVTPTVTGISGHTNVGSNNSKTNTGGGEMRQPQNSGAGKSDTQTYGYN